jgi:hypothetical protein
MKLEDQFHVDGQPDLRAYRTFLDVVGACENLPICLVVRSSQPDCLRVSSFSAPLFELLREREWFRDHEWDLISRALDEHKLTQDKPARIEYTTCFEAEVVSYLLPTPVRDIFVMCGPVWLRDPKTLREPFKKAFVEKATHYIDEAEKRFRRGKDEDAEAGDRQRHAASDSELSTQRVKRMLQHRAAISDEDLRQRVQAVGQIVLSMMHGTTPRRLNADQIERVALALCFWARRSQHLGPDPSACRLLQNADNPGNGDNLLFVMRRTPGSDTPLEFAIVSPEGADVAEDLFLRSPRSSKWSFFSDTYRNNRNVYFLERILLIRLWLQDNFSGIAAEDDEDGGDDTLTLLIQLMRKLQSILGADACILYRYVPGETITSWRRRLEPESVGAKADQKSGFLRRQAYYYAPDTKLKRTSDEEARKMIEIGADTGRADSIAYYALDEKVTRYEPDVGKHQIAAVDEKNRPRTILVTPLISRGCAWGVIEIVGSNAYQFPYSSIRWVEELSRILTPILFDHWLTFRLQEISKIAMAPARNPHAASFDVEVDKYKHVLDHVRKLLMASSARLFVQRATRTSEFVQRAHVGQEWPAGIADSFDLTDRESASAITIARRDTWSTGIIGQGIFAEAKNARKSLEKAGHLGCAIIPIYDGNRNCFASLMVTSTDNTFENWRSWEGTIEAISKNLNVVFEAIHLQETRVEARQTYFAHTIKTRAKRVDSGGEYLISLLTPLIGRPNALQDVHHFTNEVEALNHIAGRKGSSGLSPASAEILEALRKTFPALGSAKATKYSLPEIVNDLRVHLSELHKSVVFIAGGPNAEDAQDADPETWDGTRPDLRLCVLQSLKPLERGDHPKTNIRTPDRSILPLGVRVRLPQQILVEVINNLVDNAMKYDFSPPSSTMRIISSEDYYTLEFRNLAPRVAPDEARKLREFAGRSEYAKSKNRDGSGVGLRFIKDMSIAWKFDFSYDFPAQNDAELNPLGWHSLKIGFDTTVDNLPGSKWKGHR